MLRIDSKNTNYSGVSVVGDNIVAYLNGSNSGTNMHIDINIDNVDNVNFTLLKTDIDSFIDEVATFPIAD